MISQQLINQCDVDSVLCTYQTNHKVFLRVTNHTGQAEKNLLGPAGIRTRDLRFTSPMLYQLSYRSSWELAAKMVLGLFDISKQNLVSSVSRQ